MRASGVTAAVIAAIAMAGCSAKGSGGGSAGTSGTSSSTESGASGGSSGGSSGSSAGGSSSGTSGGSVGGSSSGTSGGSVGGTSGGNSTGSTGSTAGSTGRPDGGTPDAGYTCPGANHSCPSGSISVDPDAGLAALVAANPAGTTFCLQPGIHHDSLYLVTGSDGDTFTSPSGTTADGVIENGAELLAGWSQVQIGGVTYWTADAGTPTQDFDDVYYDNTHCQAPYFGCFFAQALYVDGGTYQEMTSLSGVDAGTWYYEMDGLQTVGIVSPGTGYTLGDVLAVDGGISGRVSVTSVSDAGGVADASIIEPGHDYPASATVATTETVSWGVPASGPGIGSGCTLRITAGSGGVRNNVYLAAAEAPASATVELGELPYFLESNETNDLTIQGLIVEKYAGTMDSAAISMGWSGSNGTMSGWRIQNNETRLDQHLGIAVRYGEDGGNPDWALCNWSHDNGQEGMGGGNNRVFVTIEGNTFDHNNSVHTASDYGCGGFKVGAANGMLVAYNTAHDDDTDNCCGLWSDVGSQNVTYDHNTVYNEGDGIRVEISSLHKVTNNTVYGCDGQAPGQIVSAASTMVDIENNTVTGTAGAPGIIVNFSNRNVPAPEGMVVAHNSVIVNGPKMGVELWDFNSDAGTSWEDAGIFDYNSYCVPASWDGGWASWGKGTGYAWDDFSTWQSGPSAQDPHGTIVIGSCPPP
jgi:parallel beta-helix repeat protein